VEAAELLVLGHENAVLRRPIGCVRYEPADRAWFAALARLIRCRRRTEIFPVTLLTWHRCDVYVADAGLAVASAAATVLTMAARGVPLWLFVLRAFLPSVQPGRNRGSEGLAVVRAWRTPAKQSAGLLSRGAAHG